MLERILLLGAGAREHALACALTTSASCEKLWCAPGNPGIWQVAERVSIDIADPSAVLHWCQQNKPTLVVVGPEQPLANGVSDALTANGFAVFGPLKSAAQLETSKGFAKDFMLRHNIPTASYKRFTLREEALQYIQTQPLPLVVKYDGLAAGKGVVVAMQIDEAVDAVNVMFDGIYGNHGVVIEAFLHGTEASVFALSDGANYVTLAPCHDHKRIGDGNTGKNTGGMGAIAPSPRGSNAVLQQVEQTNIEPTLRGMREEETPFVGCLYCGVMIDSSGKPSVVEFNVRFGDPETQVLLAVLDADVAALLASAARGALDRSTIRNVCQGSAACVVLAPQGYPDAYQTGFEVRGLTTAESMSNVSVFHAGTKHVEDDMYESSGTVVTTGGRVLAVTAHSTDLTKAIDLAYSACGTIDFENKYYRTDIGRTS